jgi:hypothetical protein
MGQFFNIFNSKNGLRNNVSTQVIFSWSKTMKHSNFQKLCQNHYTLM